MYTIALMIQKGGGGKTTLALNLACAAGTDGKTTLVIDLDPQATACNWSDRRKERFPDLQYPVVIDAQPARLQAALDRAAENDVQFAIIDTPARSEQSALAAAKAADLIIIPCRPQAYDLETIPNTQEILGLAGGKPAFAVLNAVPSYGNRHDQARELMEGLGIRVCPYTIGNRAAFGDAGSVGKSVAEFEPKGKGAEEILQIYKYTCSQLELSKRSQFRKVVNAR
jgi:chromosome partitioning protein